MVGIAVAMPFLPCVNATRCDNGYGPGGAGNTTRGLTHQLDTDERGLPPMVEEPSPAQQPTHRTTCPACGGRSVSDVTRETRGVMVSDQMCLNGHLYLVKWMAT